MLLIFLIPIYPQWSIGPQQPWTHTYMCVHASMHIHTWLEVIGVWGTSFIFTAMAKSHICSTADRRQDPVRMWLCTGSMSSASPQMWGPQNFLPHRNVQLNQTQAHLSEGIIYYNLWDDSSQISREILVSPVRHCPLKVQHAPAEDSMGSITF